MGSSDEKSIPVYNKVQHKRTNLEPALLSLESASMVLMLTKVYLLSNGLWPSLMAITREHEGSLESSTVIQDVRTRIPKDPRLPGVPSPSVLQQCSDPKLVLPGGLTCTHSPVRWTSTSGTSATIVEAQLVVAMD